MNGIHDMGGMHGFGAIMPEADEPVFHEQWEREVFGSVIALMAQGVYNLDEFRHGMERIGHCDYLEGSYYEHWLSGAELLLREKGIISAEAWEARVRELKANPDSHRAEPTGDKQLAPALGEGIKAGLPASRDVEAPPRFAVGDTVTVRNLQPPGHIRLPGYVRDKTGEITLHHGAHVLPDDHAHDGTEHPQHLYSVRFDARTLWGPGADANSNYIDLWESYLEPAGTGASP